MKGKIFCAVLAFLFCGCGQRSELIDNDWTVIDARYNGQPIQFHSTDRIIITNGNGKEIQSLHFVENGTIDLPGINSPAISAEWAIIDDKIHFMIDSSQYFMYNNDNSVLLSLEKSDSISRIEEQEEDGVTLQFNNPVVVEDYNKSTKIYGEPFAFSISLDTLRLGSKSVRIRAIRDRTIEDLMRNMR